MLLTLSGKPKWLEQSTSVGLSNSQTSEQGRRIEGLDLLRALAVFLVLAHHAAYRFPPITGDSIAHTLKYAGWIGVDIFFVISGFMISSILIRDAGLKDIRGFFIRRAFRILPLLFSAVTLFVAVTLVTGKEIDKLSLAWSPALLLNGWTIPFFGVDQVPFTITWSLSVEETAYALLGLSSLWGGRGLMLALVVLLVGATAFRIIMVLTITMNLYDLYFFVPARLDGIALGGVAALGAGRWFHVSSWWLYVSAFLTLGLIWGYQFVPIQHPFMPLIGYSLFGFVCAVWVASIATQDVRKQGIHPLVRKLGSFPISFGKLSYFVYLFHLFVLEGLRLLQNSGMLPELGYWSAVTVTCLLTHALAWLSWRFFEFPLIGLGRELASRTSRHLLVKP